MAGVKYIIPFFLRLQWVFVLTLVKCLRIINDLSGPLGFRRAMTTLKIGPRTPACVDWCGPVFR